MANIVLTSAARFSPYSFDEMLKPLAMATQEHNAIEEGIAELGSKADLMRMYANEEPDSKVANMYNKYANDLDKQAESLAKYGLNPTSRQGLLGLKRRYSSEITPIETAVKNRKERADEQRKLLASNPNLMFTEDFNNISLDRLIENPELGYASVSGDDLYKKGAAIAEAASKRIIETNPALGRQYYSIKTGYGEEAARQFLLNNASIPELNSAIDKLSEEAGISRLSGTDQKRARDYIVSGMMSGMSYNETLRDNKDYMTSAQVANLKASGFNADGSVDKESPIWAIKGISWGKDGKPVYTDPKQSVPKYQSIGKGRALKTNPDGTYEIINVGDNEVLEEAIKDPAKVPTRPIMVAKIGGNWKAGTKEGNDAGTYIPVIDNIWGTRSELVDWGGDWKIPDNKNTDPEKGLSKFYGTILDLPAGAREQIQEAAEGKDLNLYDIYFIQSRETGDEKYDYVLIPKNLNSLRQSTNSTQGSGSTKSPESYQNNGL